MSVYIIKDGIHNVVDEEQFERIYKPKGWCLTDSHYNEFVEGEATPVEVVGVDEVKIINYTKMAKKKKQSNKFDDKLIKQQEG